MSAQVVDVTVSSDCAPRPSMPSRRCQEAGEAATTHQESDDDGDEGTTTRLAERVSAHLVASLSRIPSHLHLAFEAHRVLERNEGGVIDPKSLVTVRQIGVGAFAHVDLCRLRNLSTGSKKPEPVAVKRMSIETSQRPLGVSTFISECAIHSTLEHPNIASFVGFGSDDTSTEDSRFNTLFLVQEYVEGGTLRDLLYKQETSGRNCYTLSEGLEICRDVATGLSYLHSGCRHKIIHRDIKPANILIKESKEQAHGGGKRRKMTAKLADFGLAKVLTDERKADWIGSKINGRQSMHSPDLTGQTGTLLYMAPEIYASVITDSGRSYQYDEKADIYALGLVIFELFRRQQRQSNLAGEAQVAQLAKRALAGERPLLPTSWPQELQLLISKCWAQDPFHRPSAAEVVTALEDMRPVLESMEPTGFKRFLCFQ